MQAIQIHSVLKCHSSNKIEGWLTSIAGYNVCGVGAILWQESERSWGGGKRQASRVFYLLCLLSNVVSETQSKRSTEQGYHYGQVITVLFPKDELPLSISLTDRVRFLLVIKDTSVVPAWWLSPIWLDEARVFPEGSLHQIKSNLFV